MRLRLLRLLSLQIFWAYLTLSGGFVAVSAQGISKKAEVDSMSYVQYLRADLRGLGATLKMARASDVDFFYLRLRAALLYARHGRYEYVYPHARRLMEMNPRDTLSQRLWMVSLLYTNRTAEYLSFLSVCDSLTYARLTGAERPTAHSLIKLETVSGGFGYLTEENYNERLNYGFLEPGALYTERTLQGPMYIQSLSVSARLSRPITKGKGNLWKTVHSLSLFESHPQGAWDASNATLINRQFSRTYRVGVAQYHGLLECSPLRAPNWSSGISWGLFSENSKYLSSMLMPDSITLSPVDLTYNNQSFLATLYGRYRLTGMELLASVGYANFAFRPQIQADAGLIWYPGGRSHLYYSGNLSGIVSISTDTAPVRLIHAHKLGTKIIKNFWGELEYAAGPANSGLGAQRGLSNYTKPLSFQTYNTVEPILNLFGAGLIHHHQRGAVRLGYQRQIRETSFYSLVPLPGASPANRLITTPKKHALHLITINLTWNILEPK